MSDITMRNRLRVHYFQHIADEGLGSCEKFLMEMNAVITTTEFFALPAQQKLEIDALPHVEDIDLLIIMGGAMSVNDEHIYPWLLTEKRWLRRFIALGRPVIGLCLGGQLIANALGAKVSKNHKKEVGWTKIEAVEPYPDFCFELPKQFEVMQWHGETFDLPKGSKLLGWNEGCQHQVFQIGDNILGFQFHPEITPKTMALYLEDEEEVDLFLKEQIELKKQLLNSVLPSERQRYKQGNQILNNAILYVLSHTSPSIDKNNGVQMMY